MSSNAYSADLRPDPTLRRVVFVSGIVLGLVGLGVIVTLDTGLAGRGVLAAAWTLSVVRETRGLQRAWRTCHGIRVFPGGAVEILGPDDDASPGRLVGGGVLLGRLGWIRLQRHDGPVFAEPICGDRRRDRDWRRLHVIWRHFGA